MAHIRGGINKDFGVGIYTLSRPPHLHGGSSVSPEAPGAGWLLTLTETAGSNAGN